MRDVPTAVELKIRLHEIFQSVNKQLNITRQKMQRQYNKNVNINTYKVGDKVWIKTKYFKTGESKKLSPRKNGPWTVKELLPNGVNFRIMKDSSKHSKVVHHNRMTPVKSMIADDVPRTVSGTTDAKCTVDEVLLSPSEWDSDEDDVLSTVSNDSDVEKELRATPERRYPQRTRHPRVIEGAIPWETLNI